MGTLIVRLEIDPQTKKKNILIKYDSDADALPLEHEEQHKKIVSALIAGGRLKLEELGTVSISRESQAAATPDAKGADSEATEAQAKKVTT